MAESTKTGPLQRSVEGDLQYFGYTSIIFANNGDTFTTPLKLLYEINLTPTTNASYGFTQSNNSSGFVVLTLVAGLGLTFQGGVTGK
jgi:hypothetical protein